MYCKKHAPGSYINVLSKQCEEEGCSKQPSFGAQCTLMHAHTHTTPLSAACCSTHIIGVEMWHVPDFTRSSVNVCRKGAPPMYCKKHAPGSYIFTKGAHL